MREYSAETSVFLGCIHSGLQVRILPLVLGFYSTQAQKIDDSEERLAIIIMEKLMKDIEEDLKSDAVVKIVIEKEYYT